MSQIIKNQKAKKRNSQNKETNITQNKNISKINSPSNSPSTSQIISISQTTNNLNIVKKSQTEENDLETINEAPPLEKIQ
jgi:hypothetical protein